MLVRDEVLTSLDTQGDTKREEEVMAKLAPVMNLCDWCKRRRGNGVHSTLVVGDKMYVFCSAQCQRLWKARRNKISRRQPHPL